MSSVIISKVGSQMRIQWTEQAGQNPELETRWVVAINRTRAFSKIASFEYVRRCIRLDVLLGILEQEYARREANDIGAKGVVRTRRNGLIVLACLFFLSLALDYLLIWTADDTNYWLLSGIVFFLLVGGNLEGASFERERVSADRAIDAAILEFELVSGGRFSYFDLELLDEDLMVYEPDNEHELEKRRAELAVNVKESLVERIEVLDNEGSKSAKAAKLATSATPD
jgi:hypothetical protein